MKSYQREFIKFLIESDILCFGQFTLKSGRISPYFFNAGLFNSGKKISQLGDFYASKIMDSKIDFDVVFGPAYKGIPIATSTVVSLFRNYQKDAPYCFNRKEAKKHGEGGNIVGAPLEGNVLLVDDVISAGTAVRESMELLKEANANLAGIVIALDRQERGLGNLSAIQEIEKQHNISVYPIITLNDVVDYLKDENIFTEQIEHLNAYRQKYGANI